MIKIEGDDLTGADIRALLELHFAGMLAESPRGHCHFLDIPALLGPGVTFWSARIDDALAGCGALKRLDAWHGEVKSMRTHPDFLRHGVAAALLDHMIAVARTEGLQRLSLETGSGPAFDPAIALYRQRGFVDCAPFADYRATDFNQFLSLEL